MAQGVTDDEVVLGTSTALSGPAALWGVSASRAAQIRFDMANEDGGVHGRQIRVVLEDHQYQVPIHVKAMNKLTNLDKVFATFNVLGTPMNLATAETQFANNVPMLFPMTPQNRCRNLSTTLSSPSAQVITIKSDLQLVIFLQQEGHQHV